MGEQPVAGDLADVEVDAVGGLVGAPSSTSSRDELDHLVDVVRGVRDVGRAARPRGASIAAHHCSSYSAATSSPGPPLGVGAVDDLVVDVGDVGDVVDLEAPPVEIAAQHVVDEGEAAVADVRGAVDGRAADVHARACPARAARASATRPLAVSCSRSTRLPY